MRRPGRRRSRRCPAAGAAAALSLALPSSALHLSPPAFTSPTRPQRVGPSVGKPHHYLSQRRRYGWSLAMVDGDGTGRADDEPNRDAEDEDEEDYSEVNSSLNKIAWLPSVKLGKQPYSPTFGKVSRKETTDGEGYEALEGSKTPPGYANIEILPVLPMTMVHGLDRMLVDNEEESVDGGISSYLGGESYGAGVWDEDPTSMMSPLQPLFSGTSGYLPHTKGHVFTVAEPRYKKLYDDLIRLGNYYGLKRESAVRRAKEVQDGREEEIASTVPADPSSLPDPDEKRRFIVTASNPAEDGVFAEYGLLFQLKDLDEVAAMASYEMGGDGMTVEELRELVESVDANIEYSDEMGSDAQDFAGMLASVYEATHDVVGRVKIHRFVNPECYSEGPEGEEYLMTEATVLDVIDNDVKMLKEIKMGAAKMEEQSTTLATARKMEEQAKEQAIGDIADAVGRIKEELRSSVNEAFKQKQEVDPELIKDKLRSALEGLPTMSYDGSQTSSGNGPIPLAPKGTMVERRSDASLNKEERALRDAFKKLVALQHELREECRFSRVSVQTFGIGPVGVWLSAAAWSQFVEKRLEATYADMQSDLQNKLIDFLEERTSSSEIGGYLSPNAELSLEGLGEGAIDFDELSPELQLEFQMVQARSAEELGPLALERAVQMQRIVQTENYTDRLNVLRECVDTETRRLEAKKMLQSLAKDSDGPDAPSSRVSREEARSLFERLMSSDVQKNEPSDEAFQ